MRKATVDEKKRCPKCGSIEGQVKAGFNRSGTQRCICRKCNTRYTLEPKQVAYPEEVRERAIKAYYSGVSGRGVGHLFRMSKSNVYNWIKKTNRIVENSPDVYELDELYWFIGEKPNTETRENVYIFTMVSRTPRQLVGFDVSMEKSAKYIQGLVDNAPDAKNYCSDGYVGYLDVVYPGVHIRNQRDKSDTFTVEGVNADLRHYIPILARRSRCFPRSLETLKAVLEVFADAYNKFHLAVYKHRQQFPDRKYPLGLVDFL